MKYLSGPLNIFHRSTHGYFLAKPYFQGQLRREVFLTVFRKDIHQSTAGFLFVTSSNVLLTLLHNLGDIHSGIYQIEKADVLGLTSEADLKDILNATGSSAEQSLSISVTNPIVLIGLNSLLLLCSIQADRTYGKWQWNLKTTYFIEKDYRDKVKRLLEAIDTIRNGSNIEKLSQPIPGISPSMAKLNIYAQGVALFVVILVFVVVALGLLSGKLHLS